MNQQDIISFFDRYAPSWDADQVDKTPIIETILDLARIGPGQHILDIACGTGILFDHYRKRGAAVTGIDISPEMVRIAREKYPDIPVYCGDVEAASFPESFDGAMIYNAFPHFPDPEGLIAHVASLLKTGGRLTVAHSASRAQIDAHHSGAARAVSLGLMEAKDLVKLFDPWFAVDVTVSDETMYQVSGVKR